MATELEDVFFRFEMPFYQQLIISISSFLSKGSFTMRVGVHNS